MTTSTMETARSPSSDGTRPDYFYMFPPRGTLARPGLNSGVAFLPGQSTTPCRRWAFRRPFVRVAIRRETGESTAHEEREPPQAHDAHPEDPRRARAQPAAALGASRGRAAGVGRLDHRQRAGLERHGTDLRPVGQAQAARQGPLLPRR